MRYRIKTQFICLLVLLQVLLFLYPPQAEAAQFEHDHAFKLKHLGYAEGLSSQRVFSIVEDRDGIIWIATKTGIDRYNGYDIQNYTLPGDFQYSDLGGRRLKLLYDPADGLWAYDNTGKIFHYSPADDRFELMLSLNQSINGEIILNKMYRDRTGTRWFGLSRGLYRQDTDGSIVQVLDGYYVNDLLAADSSLFIGTSQGTLQLTGQQTRRLAQGQDVQTLCYDTDRKELWMGTFNSGLLVCSLPDGHTHSLTGPDAAFLKPIRAITSYDPQHLLIGVDGGGIYVMRHDRKSTRLLMAAGDDNPYVLQGNGIYAITKDQQGNLWIGSYTGGVSAALLSDFPLATFLHERGNRQSPADNNINAIEEGENGHLWLATDNGISIQDSTTRHWKHVLTDVVVLSMCRDNDGHMWISTYGNGVYLLDSRGHILRHLTKQAGELTTNYVFSIKQDPDGDLWVGGLDGDLLIMRKDGSRLHTYDIKWTQSMKVIDRNRTAVGTTNGFYIVDKRETTYRQYASSGEWTGQNVSSYIVSMLFVDNHTIWLGTEGGGLNLYDLQDHTVKTYTTHDGLPSNDVYSLQYDTLGRLWASTGKGLAILENGHISSLNYVEDVEREYNKSAFACLQNGLFAYGSTKGAILINPSDITLHEYQAPLRFTGLMPEWTNAEEKQQLRPRIWQMLNAGKIGLDYAHNSFTVTFEAINHRYRHDIAYQYILDGYEKTWNDPTPEGVARYTRVSPGNYKLKVRSLRRSDGKVLAERTLGLIIAEPWWNTWWAWSLYICLTGSLFIFFLRYKSNHLQKKYDEDKIRFFINTVHNIRTPVTLIMAPLEDLQQEQELPADARYYVQAARTNARRLNALVTQLLEFEKMEANSSKEDWTVLCLNNILEEEIAGFHTYCEQKGLQLYLSAPNEPIYIQANTHLMEMLLDNLLSNACKYTPTGGHVRLRMNATRRKVVIEVEDSGIGIPRKAQRHLFTKVGRLENARRLTEEGTGFGLLQTYRIVKMLKGRIQVHSEEGHGATFTVILPRTEATPQPDTPILSVPADVPTPLPDTDRQTEHTALDNNKHHTLLIVEDHEELRHYLCKTFEHDYHVIDAADGQKALDCLKESYPDLILSDLMMPGLSGDELCRRVKTNPDTAGIPFVLLTAKAAHEDVVKGLKTGADDYIPKPFSTEILKVKVQSLIDGRDRLRRFFMRQALESASPTPVVQLPDTSVSTESETPPARSEGDQRFILQATHVVTDHLSDPDFEINTLCREMAMSRTLFYNRLKSLTGNGPQEFIRLIRLNRAAELLLQGHNVNQAAADTGFVNVKYFSVLFKKHFGIQPGKYAATQA